jgi:hypothetical protein
VGAFLRCLGTPFVDAEIVAGKQERVDVLFRSARFQIMEAVGDRKRGLDWLRRQRLYRAAKGIADVIGPYRPSKPIQFREAAQIVAENLALKAAHYGAANCATLDALVYIDLRNRHLWPLQPGPESQVANELERQGWRSVSMLFVPYAAVLSTRVGAPEFLADKVGGILNECPDPEGLFDVR